MVDGRVSQPESTAQPSATDSDHKNAQRDISYPIVIQALE